MNKSLSICLFSMSILWGGNAVADTAAEDFELYQSLLKISSSAGNVSAELDENPDFTKVDGETEWVRQAPDGNLRVHILGRLGAVVTYSPATHEVLGDSALAALIEKSDGMVISAGDTIELRFDYPTFTQYLSFKLSNGAWSETSVSTNW